MNRWHALPQAVYALVERTPETVLLECAKSDSKHPWTRLFVQPKCTLIANHPEENSELFAAIERAVAAGNFVTGYFAYECGTCFEPKAGKPSTASNSPLAWFGIYEHCYRFDHSKGVFVDGDPPGLDLFEVSNDRDDSETEIKVQSDFKLTEFEYAECIAAIHEWIRAGDIYQLNFTVPLSVLTNASPAEIYQKLRSRQPVEYGAFLHCRQDNRILSFSPELFFRIDQLEETRKITTRPMKGTAARGRTTKEDITQAHWLCNDAKNRSENVMIVDLVRNDLGRLCNYGSVHVEDIFAVERYSTLWQMTSTVTGELRPDANYQQIFRALFPCGSITGAPKVRAMQLIAELEQEPRGIYTGAIGFFSAGKTVFNVAIRTLELNEQDGITHGRMGVGSGIVADSVASAEFRECAVKSEFLTGISHCSPIDFSLIETMLWSNGFELIELHLDRLTDSASYFDFPFDRLAIQSALLEHARGFSSTDKYKVRLLLDSDGDIRITSELLAEPTKDAKIAPGRVCMATIRTDSSDRMLFHKTTHRPIYSEAYQKATCTGFDDVLFLNQHGEVTEGAISNLFIVKDGQWTTPPIDCGLLAGVYRRHLLATQSNVEERVINLDDLYKADEIYLTNAVRGLRRVIVLKEVC